MPDCLTSLASGPLKAKLFGQTPKGTTFGTPFSIPREQHLMAVAAGRL